MQAFRSSAAAGHQHSHAVRPMITTTAAVSIVRRPTCSIHNARHQQHGWLVVVRAAEDPQQQQQQQQQPSQRIQESSPQQQQQQQQYNPPPKKERDLLIPIAVAISLAGYALVAIVGLIDSLGY